MIVCGREIRVQGRLIRVARLDAEKYHFVEDPEPLVAGLKELRSRIDLFTFLQRLPETAPKFSYPVERDNLAVLPVSTFDHWWSKQIGFKARNKAKQAEKKGVTSCEMPFNDTLVQGIWEVYNESSVRQGKPNLHYGKDMNTVRAEAATYLDSSIFIGAFFADKLIGFLKLVTDETASQAGIMNIVAMIKHRDKAPTNQLIAHAVRICAARKISYLVYSKFAYGTKQPDSLSDFKERNGFQRVDVPRYYVPLTAIGRIALQLGLHQRFVDHLPQAVVTKLRDFRRAWYNHKFLAARETQS